MVKNNKGFTLIELLITMSIVVILATIGTLNFVSYKAKNDLRLAGEQLLSVLRETQQKSISQETGKVWGVRITNAVEGDDYYEVFSGASYSSDAVTLKKTLERGVSFGNPVPEKYYDIKFIAITGRVSVPAVITLISSSKDTFEIDVKTNGTILGGVEEGLVGFWDFEEGLGNTAYDKSSYQNNGTWVGTGSRYTTGKVGSYAATFSGSGDYINCGLDSSLNIGSAMTLAFWIKGPSPNGEYAQIIARYGSPTGWIVQVRQTNPEIYLRLDTSAGANQTTGTFTALDNTWHHAVFVVDNGNKRYYLDGNPAYTGTYNHGDGFANPSAQFRIAASIFMGQLDDVRVYNRALSAQEAKEIYEKGI